MSPSLHIFKYASLLCAAIIHNNQIHPPQKKPQIPDANNKDNDYFWIWILFICIQFFGICPFLKKKCIQAGLNLVKLISSVSLLNIHLIEISLLVWLTMHWIFFRYLKNRWDFVIRCLQNIVTTMIWQWEIEKTSKAYFICLEKMFFNFWLTELLLMLSFPLWNKKNSKQSCALM